MSFEIQSLKASLAQLPPLPKNGTDYNLSMFDQTTINAYVKSVKATELYDTEFFTLPYSCMGESSPLQILRVKPLKEDSPAFNPSMLNIDFPAHMRLSKPS